MDKPTVTKNRLLALIRERQGNGTNRHDWSDPDQLRARVAELRDEDYKFITFRPPGQGNKAHYTLAEFSNQIPPNSTILRDDQREGRRKQRGSVPPPPPGPQIPRRRTTGNKQREYKQQEVKAQGSEELWWRGRRRMVQSIENLTSIPEMLMATHVPEGQLEDFSEEVMLLRVYSDTLLGLLDAKMDDQAVAATIAKITRLAEDPSAPEGERQSARAAIERMERNRQNRLSA